MTRAGVYRGFHIFEPLHLQSICKVSFNLKPFQFLFQLRCTISHDLHRGFTAPLLIMGDVRVAQSTAITRPVKTVYPVHNDDNGPVVEVDHLVIGAGPAGASMGCFLGQHGDSYFDNGEARARTDSFKD
jgi:hypothetical protein